MRIKHPSSGVEPKVEAVVAEPQDDCPVAGIRSSGAALDYERAWEATAPLMKAKFLELRSRLEGMGIKASLPETEMADEYSVAMTVYGDEAPGGSRVALLFTLLDGAGDGEEGRLSVMVNGLVKGGVAVLDYAPCNYTEDFWTSDVDELRRRIEQLSVSESAQHIQAFFAEQKGESPVAKTRSTENAMDQGNTWEAVAPLMTAKFQELRANLAAMGLVASEPGPRASEEQTIAMTVHGKTGMEGDQVRLLFTLLDGKDGSEPGFLTVLVTGVAPNGVSVLDYAPNDFSPEPWPDDVDVLRRRVEAFSAPEAAKRIQEFFEKASGKN